MQWLQLLSRTFDVGYLDSFIIAWDYDAALASVDRGVGGLQPLERSHERAVGVAMSVPVIREGKLRSVLVLHAGLVQALLDESHTLHSTAVYTLAHELAHIQDLKTKDQAWLGALTQYTPANDFETYLSPIALGCWDEYVACRLSARFYQDQLSHFEETFLMTFFEAKKESDKAIAEYRINRDIGRLFKIALMWHGDLLKFASYFIGHLHGLENPAPELTARVSSAIAGSYFEHTYSEVEQALLGMWNRYPGWAGLEVYEPLTHIVSVAMRRAGLTLSKLPNGRLYLTPTGGLNI
jgi:hypothetical protein